jgi:hypothetical protein
MKTTLHLKSAVTHVKMDSLRCALGRRSGHWPNEPGSQRPGESESWNYPTARSSPRLELWRVEFANTKRFGLAGLHIAGNGFPWNRANFTLYYDGPPDTWMQGLDADVVVNWIGQHEDDNAGLTGSPKFQMPRTGGPNNPALYPFRARKIAAWTTCDLMAS